MKLLFNKDGQGNRELKQLLGYLDADFKFVNLQTDIEHASIDLIELIGQTTYDKLIEFYNQAPLDGNATDQEKEQRDQEDSLVKKAQLPIVVFAELAFASNNDLNSSNNGRVVDISETQRQPWEWQIERAESNSRRRGYKALDLLLAELDDFDLAEWKSSDQFKESKKFFIHTTDQMHRIYQIGNSRQLYLRLQMFMEDPELEEILPIIGEDRFAALKTAILDENMSDDQAYLLKLVQRPVGFRSLETAFGVLPVEMFPNGLVEYREKGRMSSQARSEVQLFFKSKADSHLTKLHNYIQGLSGSSEVKDLTENIEGNNYVNL